MIDIHTHILPAIDDGARDLDVALEMARMAVADGIHQMIATPHNADWEEKEQREGMIERLHHLQSSVENANIGLHLYLGSEVHITPDLVQRMKQGQMLTLNGSRYILLELPFSAFPHYLDQVLFELALEGITAVLAHAERYSAVQEKIELIPPLVERGVLVQITSGSLGGTFGSQAKQTAITLLRRRLAHIIASDAHNTDLRPPLLSEAVTIAAEYVGREQAERMVTEVPRAILENVPIAVAPPLPPQHRRKWFGRW
ncbi:MAG: hypothetical protein GXP41_00850 [Chloroflexi bacterium]|nr:hypothetical protein [Chloroflexota bacterium]